ncbi:Coiled-coil domain-containing protein 12 [Hondaea fermentalgiana]|uniref:Coiled-coil domain-containing protein 12 n=1 Tax=Hondaea fermentalgiana TaxID=2315210 RepID=A0A2R5GII0_9STRA|nr:Coiled-coil domain-containing protein 12 [Hondaea fermentalgiana]|eukprot:GBG28463.1 Coiled-coil domain-containing protein 12 [Hondaea fermentalgiana]
MAQTGGRKLRFRNYVPSDSTLAARGGSVGATDAAGEDAGTKTATTTAKASGKLLEATEARVKELEARAAETARKGAATDATVTPRKINWDLKRDAAKPLAKLARRTQRAIVELAEEEAKRRRLEDEDEDEEEDEDEDDDDDDEDDDDDDEDEDDDDDDDEEEETETNNGKSHETGKE